MKIALGLLLALAVGVVCRLVGLPLPAPLALTGAVLVLAMSAGYELVDRLAPHREATPARELRRTGRAHRDRPRRVPPDSWGEPCFRSPWAS